jgi:tRNA pseudouridine13 synthase
MKLKQRVEDFRVRELLMEEPRKERDEFRVYRVTKRKLTSVEAAAELAREAGAVPADVSMAGLKDRQGVTIQHMALERGPVVSIKRPDLRIETVGWWPEALTPAHSEGNAFEIVVRALDQETLDTIRGGLGTLREEGLINYFDDQRFGNLRHGQGWVVLDLIRGDHEKALKRMLASLSRHDGQRHSGFKAELRRRWGDWQACRDAAGRFGAHHSVFEHLKRNPDDFAGAFGHVATRVRLIHLYAFQSHLWNRAVAELVRARTGPRERIVVRSLEGALVFPVAGAGPSDPKATFRLPGVGLADVTDATQRELLEEALAVERLVPADLEVRGVPGFAFKGEDRPLVVRPAHLRIRPAEPDPLNRGMRLVRIRFELPRGSYATLLVRRLAARPVPPRETPQGRGPRR